MAKGKRPALTPEQRARKNERDREYRARKVAEARAAGLPASVGWGKAKRAGLPSVAELRSSGVLPAPRTPRAPKVLRATNGPGGEVVYRTGNKASMQRMLRQAADAGQNVAIRGTFRTGAGWRQVTLDGSTAEQRSFVDRLGGGSGGGGQGGDDGGDAGELGGGFSGRDRVGRTDTPTSRGGRDSGAVEMRVGGAGISAADLWAAWMAYDGEWWDFLADWADSEY